MITLSLCMIVKNEEDVLGRCLECVKDIADEIVIVDTGSTDKTKEIAKNYTDKQYDFPWIDDFSAARNYSFSQAAMDYVMWLDADDVIDEKNRQELIALKNSLDPSIDMVMMKYNVAFDENENPTFSYYRERIFKRSMNYRWVGQIHEVISQHGNVLYSETAVFHKKIRPNAPDRNLKIFEKILSHGEPLDPRQQFYYARELYYNARYEEAIEHFIAFLQEGRGWVENNISACQDLALCYYQLKDNSSALEAYFKSFTYDQPRAEICCDIGKHFLDQNEYKTAIFWYELALGRQMNERGGGFILPDRYGYTPCIQLCVCHDRLGDYQKASEYNEKAGAFKPDDKSYLYNKQYFGSILNKD